jgi:hypothetical protein
LAPALSLPHIGDESIEIKHIAGIVAKALREQFVNAGVVG